MGPLIPAFSKIRYNKIQKITHTQKYHKVYHSKARTKALGNICSACSDTALRDQFDLRTLT